MYLLAAFLFLAQSAADSQPVADSGQQALEDKRPCTDSAQADYPWFDKAHLLLSSQVCRQALWFDNFFADEDQLTNKHATSLIWLNVEQTWHKKDGWTSGATLKGVIDLPNSQKRLKLIFEGQDNRATQTQSELTNRDDSTSTKNSALIRYQWFDSSQWQFDLDLGLRFSTGPFGRARVLYRAGITEATVATYRQDFVLSTEDSWYEVSTLFVDHFTPYAAYRFNSELRYGEKSHGLEWRLSGYQAIQASKRSVVTNFFIVEGATSDPQHKKQSERIRTGINLRRSIWRPWFFYELQPQVIFPRSSNYQLEYQITAAIELQFGRSRKRGYF